MSSGGRGVVDATTANSSPSPITSGVVAEEEDGAVVASSSKTSTETSSPRSPVGGGRGTLKLIQTLTPDDDDGDDDASSSPTSSVVVPAPSSSVAWHCEFSNSGTLLAACYGAPDCSVRIWARRRVRRRSRREKVQHRGPRGGASSYDAMSSSSSSSSATPLARSTIPEDDEVHHAEEADTDIAAKDDEGDGEEEFKWYLACTLSGVHERTVRSLAFAPGCDDRVLATASFDGTVCIWERMDELVDHSSIPSSSGANPDGGGDGKVEMKTKMNWECTAQLEGHDSEVKDVAWNSTGTLLATCGRDRSVWIWECVLPGSIGGDGPSPTGGEGEYDCVAVLNGHEGDVKCVEFVRANDRFGDGEDVVISGSYDDTLRVWAEDDTGDWYSASTLDMTSSCSSSGGDGRKTGGGGTVWAVGVSRGGERLVSGHDDGSLSVWKCHSAEGGGDGTWRCVGVLPGAHHGRTVYGVHCAPERSEYRGRIVSCGGDDSIHVYREEEEEEGVGDGDGDAPKFSVDASAPSAHRGDVNCVRWHPRDGGLLASAGDDGVVRVWRYESSSPVA